MLHITSNNHRQRSAFGKLISKAALVSMLGPRLGAGAAVTKSVRPSWSGARDCLNSSPAQSVAGAVTGVVMTCVEAQGRKLIIPADRGNVWEEASQR